MKSWACIILLFSCKQMERDTSKIGTIEVITAFECLKEETNMAPGFDWSDRGSFTTHFVTNCIIGRCIKTTRTIGKHYFEYNNVKREVVGDNECL